MKMTQVHHSLILLSISLLCRVACAQETAVICEFMASNSEGLQDEDGDYSDWIEIVNSSETTISLTGWSLTDNGDFPAKWSFPATDMEPGEFIVVFASGKDRKAEKNKLHTNFKLSSSGEFLALVMPGGTNYATAFSPAYPEQYSNISFGTYNTELTYFSDPTPGSANVRSTFIPPPCFSVHHGHYIYPFELELTCSADSLPIYYTTDASIPAVGTGTLYTAPLFIDSTVVIRAMAEWNGLQSYSVTQSYIFPADVIHQAMFPAGYPGEWLQPVDGTDDHIPIASDYGMHERVVVSPSVSPVISHALMDLPVISIVSDIDHFFSTSTHPDSGGIYMYTGAPDGPTRNLQYHLGHGWIRPASMEYFDVNDESVDFQINCGIELHGGATRTPWKTAKHSFKLGFKAEYGPVNLNQNLFGEGTPGKFDWLILRGGFALRYGQQIYDPWAKSTMRDMGHYAAFSRFVHVYLNGQYWGLYNLCERMDNNCMSDHFGGEADEYDIIKDYYEVESGDTMAWSELVTRVQDNIADTANYQRLLGNNPDGTHNVAYEKLVDAENLIDYMLMNFYAGNTDWDFHNWVAARRRVNSEGFKFFPWDGEYILQNAYENIVALNIENRPSGIFHDLMDNGQFRELFISRVNRHFFADGALTPQPCYNRYFGWRALIDTSVVCESARWNSESNPKGDIWETGYHINVRSFFPSRTEIVFNQLISQGMYPMIEPPQFNAENGYIPDDFQLFITGPSGGDILYTLNGSDPGFSDESSGGTVIVYDGNPVPLVSDTVVIKARVKTDALWSRLVSKRYFIGTDPAGMNPGNPIVAAGKLRCYPNPAHGYINFSFTLTESSAICLSIYSLTGEKVIRIDKGILEKGTHVTGLNTGNIPPGNYFCFLESMNKPAMQRIMFTLE